MFSSEFNKKKLWVVWLYVIIVFALLIMRPSAEMSDMMKIPGLDKIAHAGIFGIFSSLILWSLVGSITKRDWLLALLISSFYGFGLECVQKISFTNRNFDYYDIIANIIGAIIGATILIIVKKKTYE